MDCLQREGRSSEVAENGFKKEPCFSEMEGEGVLG